MAHYLSPAHTSSSACSCSLTVLDDGDIHWRRARHCPRSHVHVHQKSFKSELKIAPPHTCCACSIRLEYGNGKIPFPRGARAGRGSHEFTMLPKLSLPTVFPPSELETSLRRVLAGTFFKLGTNYSREKARHNCCDSMQLILPRSSSRTAASCTSISSPARPFRACRRADDGGGY